MIGLDKSVGRYFFLKKKNLQQWDDKLVILLLLPLRFSFITQSRGSRQTTDMVSVSHWLNQVKEMHFL